MSHFVKLVLIIFVGAAVMLGCAKPVTSGIGSSQMTASDNYTKHLKLDNPKLAKKLQITNIITRKNNDLLQLNLELSSKYKKSQTLQYHFEWFDDQNAHGKKKLTDVCTTAQIQVVEWEGATHTIQRYAVTASLGRRNKNRPSR